MYQSEIESLPKRARPELNLVTSYVAELKVLSFNNKSYSLLPAQVSTDILSRANTVEYSEVLAHPALVLLCRISVKLNLLITFPWGMVTGGQQSQASTWAAIPFFGGGEGMGTLLCIYLAPTSLLQVTWTNKSRIQGYFKSAFLQRKP